MRVESGDLNMAALSTRNIHAWERLYSRVGNPVWGRSPIAFLEEFIRFLKTPISRRFRILDAGSGEGRNLERLLATGACVTACDASESALRKAISCRGLADTMPCTRCDLAYMPFAAAMFDFILLADVVETLPNVEAVLKEVYRVLKTTGILLCNVPGLEDEVSADDMMPLGNNRFLYRGQFFFQFFSPMEAVNLMERNGFTILRNELHSWGEEAHPGFRHYRHIHTSRIFLVTKAES